MSKHHRRHPARRARRDSSDLQQLFTEAIQGAPQIRGDRLEHILHTELQSLLRDEVADPHLEGIVLLAVELSPDAGHARIGFAVRAAIDQEREARARTRIALDRANGFLRARLATQLDLKRVPRLTFTFVGVTAAPSGSGSEGGAR